MKRLTMTLFAAVLCSIATMNAQSIYELNKFSLTENNGTARYIGMGGAMSALGGDVTTMSTNPAGTGIFRSDDANISFSIGNRSISDGVNSTNKFKGSFDNFGIVITNKYSNIGALRFLNFGINYRKVKNFDSEFKTAGTYDGSQTDQMARLSEGLNPADFKSSNTYEPLYNNDVPWLGVMGWEGNMIEPDADGLAQNPPVYRYNSLMGYDANTDQKEKSNGNFWSKESGGMNEFDFNVSANIYDMLYLGASVGIYSLDYKKNTVYSESYNADASSYTLESWIKNEGTGVDFKLGAILRPFPSSPLRFGAFVHTPMYMSATMYNSSRVESAVDLDNNGSITKDERFTFDSFESIGDTETKYSYVSPWRYNFSVGYTFAKMLALGAEYERTEYGSASYSYKNGGKMNFENNNIDECLGASNTYKLGAELRILPGFAIRTGWNYQSSAMKKDSFLNLPQNSIRTDTDYENITGVHNYSAGLSLRSHSGYYLDFAYQLSHYRGDFYAFDGGANESGESVVAATSMKHNYNRLTLTLGMRF